ncbi:MAG TPA: BrnT family toxin [Candidatus Acidoferrales bacterium]|jgi:uncharacterized DUF497 family protein|nr:BrnT family toxin [Candidatus Acidoferrales bacterium]
MQFEWDRKKNTLNIKKHGIDFSDGEELFSGAWPLLVAADLDNDLAEERWRGIGCIQGRVVVAVFTEPKADVIRFISLRKANQEERQAYEEAIRDELESS